jgi:hypothetical protein
MKIYLGDGVYVEVSGSQEVKLTTSDGLSDTNTIFLEHTAMEALITWYRKEFL